MSSAVQVAVRVRPFNEREKKLGGSCVLSMNGLETCLKDPSKPADEGRKFVFNHSLWTHDPSDKHFVGQEETFQRLGTGALDNAFEGYNACIFAYGQTGSGKTYTMMGPDEDPGIIPRLCMELFGRIATSTDENVKYKVEVRRLWPCLPPGVVEDLRLACVSFRWPRRATDSRAPALFCAPRGIPIPLPHVVAHGACVAPARPSTLRSTTSR